MNTIRINGKLYAEMVRKGAETLNAYRSIVNDLNVFPIPDGDTGDNMYMTIDSGAGMLNDNVPESLEKTSDIAAKGMLFGARGNSGVILSRIFYGIATGFRGKDSANVHEIASAFENGVKEAYGAVSVPVEGTILTVYKDAVAYAGSRITEKSTVESYFEDFTKELHESLDRTPDLLDVLKEAGVVDSGGAGFIYIAEGMKDALDGYTASADAGVTFHTTPKHLDFDKFTSDSELSYGYCTEFLLRLQNAKTDIEHFDLEKIDRYLNSVGDSVVAFREGSILKVHVHTKTPGDVLNEAQKYGEFLTLKIENMTLQNNETTIQNRFTMPAKVRRKRYGIVSVAAGEGIKKTFSSLGCDVVVDGGQSMNPSAEDLVRAFDQISAKTILVFPNNSNITLTAQQAAKLYDKATVRIVPTRTIGEGYAAISMMDTNEKNADKLISDLCEVIAQVKTGIVSKAVRSANKDGIRIEKDDYIGFADGRVLTDQKHRPQAVGALLEKMNAGSFDILIVICGSDTTDSEAKELYNSLQNKYRRTEVIMIDGGQPVYDYILILE